MGQKAFPSKEKLEYIVTQIIGNISDNDIQEALESKGPQGDILRGNYGAYGAIGNRTLLHIRSIVNITKTILEPRFVLLNNPSVRKAKEEHLDELRSLIEYLRSACVTAKMVEIHPCSLFSMRETEKLPLFIHLKEHLPDDKLWGTYNKYIKTFDLYLREVQSLENTILDDINEWTGVMEVTDSAFLPIFQQVVALEKGKAPFSYRFSETPASIKGTNWMGVNGQDILRAKETKSLQERYAKYSQELILSNAVVKIIRKYKESIKLENWLREYIDGILIKHEYLFHSCSICPDTVAIEQSDSSSHIPGNIPI